MIRRTNDDITSISDGEFSFSISTLDGTKERNSYPLRGIASEKTSEESESIKPSIAREPEVSKKAEAGKNYDLLLLNLPESLTGTIKAIRRLNKSNEAVATVSGISAITGNSAYLEKKNLKELQQKRG